MPATESIRLVFFIFDLKENQKITSHDLLKLLEEARGNNSMEGDLIHIISNCRQKLSNQKVVANSLITQVTEP